MDLVVIVLFAAAILYALGYWHGSTKRTAAPEPREK